jgi:hypothetical protein
VSADHDAKRRLSLAQISVLVGILGTVVTTAFLIADRVGMDAPEVLAAELTNVRTTPSVTLHDHLAGTRRLERFIRNGAASGISSSDLRAVLATQGVEVAYDLTIEGPPGRKLRVAATLFRARSGRPMPNTGLEQRTSYVSEAKSDKLTDRVWVPAPPAAGRYVTRVDVIGDGDVTVASATTPPFRLP